MDRKLSALSLLALLCSVDCGPGVPSEQGNMDAISEQTIAAQAAFRQAKTQTQQTFGAEDLVLQQLSTQALQADGTSAQWTIVLYSESQDQGYLAQWIDGQLIVTPGAEVSPPPVSATWVDSDAVIQQFADQYGFSQPVLAILAEEPPLTPADCQPCWDLTGGDNGLIVDADSGEVVMVFSYSDLLP